MSTSTAGVSTGSLAREALEPLLAGRLGRPYTWVERCESTQLLLEADAPEGAAAACDEQTAGRGRLGRRWVAPPGTALLCSVALSPPSERRLAELSLVGGVAAADTVERALGLATQIKWPNDVMVNRSKVAGVLAEARGRRVVLGIGMNVNQTREQLPADAATPPASLRTIDGTERDRAPLLADLLLRLEHAYDAWCEGGLDAVYDALGARDFLRGRRVTVDGRTGEALRIDRQGRLQVTIDGETRTIESGEVTYER